MLTAGQLADARLMQSKTLDKTASVRRRVFVNDSAGRPSENVSTVATVACRLAPAKTADRERVEAARFTGQTMWRITVPALTDVRVSDRFEIGARAFEIVAVWGEESRETARVCLCVER